jgi:hypothetical protein
MGVFAAVENITSGALSVSERPFHSAKPSSACVPTSYGACWGQPARDLLPIALRGFRRTIGGNHGCDPLSDSLSVGCEVVGRAPGIEMIAEILVVL